MNVLSLNVSNRQVVNINEKITATGIYKQFVEGQLC